MAKPLMIKYDGVIYHVILRRNAIKPTSKDDKNRKIFLDLLHRINTYSASLFKNRLYIRAIMLETRPDPVTHNVIIYKNLIF